MLTVVHTEQYNGSVKIDNVPVVSLSQNFDEKGMRSGNVGEYIIDKDLYIKNITQCRSDEDEFLRQMRAIEDEHLKPKVGKTV
ncbi:MAG: hypothetical protein RR623_08530 [Bacilli bacterium]